MLGFLKNIFGNRQNENGNVFQHQAPAPAPAPVRTATPGTQFHPRVPRAPVQGNPHPAPAAPVQVASDPGGSITIPLAAVLTGLPLELKAHVRPAEIGDATLSVSVNRVLSQISTGAVKLPFGELREAAPELFTENNIHDHVQVSLPLNEILSRVDPALLVRRQNQRHIDVPQEINSPFDGRGNGLALSAAPKAPEATPPPRSVKPAAPPAPKSVVGFDQFTRKPSAPAVPSPSPAPAPVVAAPAASQPIPTAPQRPAVVPRTPAQPAVKPAVPQPMAHQPARSAGLNPGLRPAIPQPAAPARPEFTPAAPVVPPQEPEPLQPTAIPASSALRSLGASIGLTAPTNTPSAQAQRAATETPSALKSEQIFLSVPLQPLTDNWSDALRQEIAQLNLSQANLAIPFEILDDAIRRGKVAFPWKTVRSWIKPATLPSVSVHDTSIVELPLMIIAPLFIARKRDLGKPRHKVAIDENIPNLFFGFPQPEAESHEAAAAPTPAPAAPVAPVVPPAPAAPPAPVATPLAAPAPVETNYYVWDESSDSARVDETEFKRKPSIETNFLSRYATPNEVVARATALEGVVGALVALPDGLMVASKLPQELNGDTLAAFLPQIFGKVSQCTKELRMGELNNLNFTVGNVPWKIFRVNAIFFAAFGRAGHALPTAQLANLAAQLDRKKQ